MALIATKGKVPDDAIALSRSEALEYQWKQIEDWPRTSDVWPFSWGKHFLAGIAAASSMYINGRYRRKLKLRHYGFVTTSFPMIIAPAMFSVAYHHQVITADLMLRETSCLLCVQYKAAMIQIGSAVVYPVIMSPIANFMYAVRHATYRLPYWSDARGTFRLWWKMTKPMGQSFLVQTCIQGLGAIVFTYFEADKLNKIQIMLAKQREKAELKKANRQATKEMSN